MARGFTALSALLQLFVAVASASPLAIRDDEVDLDGYTFVNKGLVAFGLIPSNTLESTGDTLGGLGSAMAIKYGSWKQSDDGSFSGTLVMHPDRGYNVCVFISSFPLIQ
jgi:hypothetical protein